MSTDSHTREDRGRSNRLRELVEECIAVIEDRGPVALEAFLRAHPEHETRLRARMKSLMEMGLIEASISPGREIPEKLGDFRLFDLLGRGGMGAVYRARQESLGREVAVKLIRPEHLYFTYFRALKLAIPHDRTLPSDGVVQVNPTEE